jgi:acyl dehydratase
MRIFTSLRALQECVGQEIAVSDWLLVEQSRIDQFAEATGDHNWVHVDKELAARGPFGKTIAHGFLTLSLIPILNKNAFAIENTKIGLNYGLNKVRFPAPLPVDSRVRGRFTLLSMESVAPIGENPGYQITYEVTIEREGESKPVCVAESIQRRYG